MLLPLHYSTFTVQFNIKSKLCQQQASSTTSNTDLMTTLKLNLVLSVNGVRDVESIFLFTFQSIFEYLLVFELDN